MDKKKKTSSLAHYLMFALAIPMMAIVAVAGFLHLLTGWPLIAGIALALVPVVAAIGSVGERRAKFGCTIAKWFNVNFEISRDNR